MKLPYRSRLRDAIRVLARRSRSAGLATATPQPLVPPPADGKPPEIIEYEISTAVVPQVHSFSAPPLAAVDSEDQPTQRS